LNNVVKYADASRAIIRLEQTEDHVTFEIEDDGRGFDPNEAGHGTGLQGMSDRLAAVGGTLDVASAPGRGTRVTGRIRVRAEAAA
jgi:signal transduction histidine kinase